MEKDRIWTLLARKMANEATTIELAELQQLMNNHADVQDAVHTIEQNWNEHPTTDNEFLEATYLIHLERMREKGIDFEDEAEEIAELLTFQKASFWSEHKATVLSVVAVALAAIIVMFVGITPPEQTVGIAQNNAPQTNVISTKNGSRTKIDLPDGTKVWLNAGSNLTYDNTFGRNNREVNLVGEAFFDVTKKNAQPFIIHTNKMDIRVLGTAFNVMCYPDAQKVETSLIRGSIEVTLRNHPSEKIYLKPNEKLTLLNDHIVSEAKKATKKLPLPEIAKLPEIAISHITYLPIDSSIIETSWVDNKLIFRSETFEEVSKKMEKWYDVKIMFKNDELKSVHLTGSFEKESIYDALVALQLTTPFKFNIDKQKIITITN